MRDVPVRTNPLDAFSMSALFCMLGPESYRRERFASMNLRCHASVSAPKYGTTRKIVSPERSRNMPFYRWDEMKRKNLARPSDSEGSIIIGEHVTLNRSVSRPGKLARPHTHDCEQIINVVEGTAWFRVGDEGKIRHRRRHHPYSRGNRARVQKRGRRRIHLPFVQEQIRGLAPAYRDDGLVSRLKAPRATPRGRWGVSRLAFAWRINRTPCRA